MRAVPRRQLRSRRSVGRSASIWPRNPSFRAYTDHMATDDFRDALAAVAARAPAGTVSVMCSESVWWRCHGRLIAEAAVLLHGSGVRHHLTTVVLSRTSRRRTRRWRTPVGLGSSCTTWASTCRCPSTATGRHDRVDPGVSLQVQGRGSCARDSTAWCLSPLARVLPLGVGVRSLDEHVEPGLVRDPMHRRVAGESIYAWRSPPSRDTGREQHFESQCMVRRRVVKRCHADEPIGWVRDVSSKGAR